MMLGFSDGATAGSVAKARQGDDQRNASSGRCRRGGAAIARGVRGPTSAGHEVQESEIQKQINESKTQPINDFQAPPAQPKK